MAVNVAVVGATGAVGDLMRQVLAERQFPVKTIKFLASEKSAGKTVEFAGKPYPVEPLRPEAFAGVQIVLSSTPSSVSQEYSPIAAQAGAIVVDNSSAWRMDPDCPLVVPEVNADALHHIKKGIVANPNCVGHPAGVALKPLHDLGRSQARRRLHLPVVVRQGGDGPGRLRGAARRRGSAASRSRPRRPTRASSPATSSRSTGRSTRTATPRKRTRSSTRRGRSSATQTIGVCPTCVRVPVQVAHSEAVNVEFDRPVSRRARRRRPWRRPPASCSWTRRRARSRSRSHAAGKDHTFVGRVRQDPSHPNALNLWVVADNLRKGAATNAVQVRRGAGPAGDRRNRSPQSAEDAIEKQNTFD